MKLLLVTGLATQITAKDCNEYPNFSTLTLPEKYVQIYEMPEETKNKYKYECFQPYETNMVTKEGFDFKSVVHQWPNCDMDNSDAINSMKSAEGSYFEQYFCLDREHMFNWMVNDLTGFEPKDFYKCIPEKLNLYDRNKEMHTNVIDTTNGDYATREADCKANKGMMVFNNGDDFQERMTNWKLEGDITVASDNVAKIFGNTIYQYCYYTPMMMEIQLCKDLCNRLEGSELFKIKSYLEMYCKTESTLLGKDLIVRSDKFENYLEGL